MEHNFWCAKCRVLRIVFDTQIVVMDGRMYLNGACVFCRGPLVPVTDEIKKEYPDG